MKLLILIAIICVTCVCIKAGYDETIPNNVIFEKLTYEIFNKTLVKDAVFKWKKIAYNVVTLNASTIFTEPFKDIWMHGQLYYKYREYQKYLIDIWLDYCSIVKAPDTHPAAQKIWDIWLSYRDSIELNFDIQCPLSGKLTIRSIRSLNVSHLVIPLMQAGRYRADLKFSTRQNGPIVGVLHLYFAISDLRVWF